MLNSFETWNKNSSGPSKQKTTAALLSAKGVPEIQLTFFLLS